MTHELHHNDGDAVDSHDTVSRIVMGVYGVRNAAWSKAISATPALNVRNLSRARVLVFATYIGAMFLTYPAVAQFQELGERLCESGIGQILGVVFAMFSIYFLFKCIFKVMNGLDKHRSSKPGEHEEGVEQLESSASTFMAALVPALAAIFFELVGINTFSCLVQDIGIIN